jgi:hypothetical protein
VNIGTALKVRDALGIDLQQPEQGEPPLLTRLGTDELLLGEVICCLLADQFEAHKVTADDVRAGFDGQTLLAAQTAFYEELVGFFRSRGRTDRARAVETQGRVIAEAVKAIEARIETLDVGQAIRLAVSEPAEPNRGALSGPSPEPSASTPGR